MNLILDNMFFQHFHQNVTIKKRKRTTSLKYRHQIICKNTGQTFANTTKVADYYNVNTYQIYETCKYKRSIWIGNEKMYFEFKVK